jgi:parallel beta-helix repeat protein
MTKRLTSVIAIMCLFSIMISGLFLIGTLQFGLAQGSTNESGIIRSDTIWTQAGSPYNLIGNVSVNYGVSLTIQAGATINLNSYCITVNGALIAKGTSTNKIQINGMSGEGPFMPAPAPNPYPFTYGINFTKLSVGYNAQSGSGSIIENAIINSTTMALESSPKIYSNVITGYITSNGTSVISNNLVTGEIHLTGPSTVLNNKINGTVSVQTDIIGGSQDADNLQGTPMISNNTIIGGGINGIGISFLTAFTNHIVVSDNTINNCNNAGVAAEGIGIIQNNLISSNHDGIDIEGSNTVLNNTIENNYIGIQQISNFLSSIAYNNIQNNSYNFFLHQSVTGSVNATYNYWGTTNQTAISNSIYDNKDDSSLGTVNFVPFLTALNTQSTSPTATVPEFPSLEVCLMLIVAASVSILLVTATKRKIGKTLRDKIF